MLRSHYPASQDSTPKGYEKLFDRDAIILRRHWRSWKLLPLVFFTAFWNGFMVVWMSIAISSGIWIMAAFGSIHAAVGLWLLYTCLANFLNKTDITIHPLYLEVKHFPLPWFGNRKLETHRIDQLYVFEKVRHNKNRIHLTYEVYAQTSGAKPIKLLSGLTDHTDAVYIEQEIESILGIKDESVKGEFGKR